MANRYQEDLKRIIGIDENRKGLGAAAERPAIVSNKGIGYIDAAGQAQGVKGSDPGAPDLGGVQDVGIFPASVQGGDADALAGEDGENSTDANGKKFEPGGNRGGVIDPLDTSSKIIGKETGQYTGDEIFGNAGPTPGNTLQNDAGLQLSGGVLKEVIVEDCDTGKEMRIRTDGLYTPPEATYTEEFVQDDTTKLTNEFTDPDTAVDTYKWEFGFAWFTGSPINEYTAGPMENVAEARNILEANFPGNIVENEWVNPNLLRVFGDIGGTILVSKSECAALPDPKPAACLISESTSFIWPINGFYESTARSDKLTRTVQDSFILSFEGGAFNPHDQDTNVPPHFSPGASEIDFCWGTNQFGKMLPTKEGGFMIYETVAQGGAPLTDGIVRLYDADGVATGYSDVPSITAFRAKDS